MASNSRNSALVYSSSSSGGRRCLCSPSSHPGFVPVQLPSELREADPDSVPEARDEPGRVESGCSESFGVDKVD